MNSARAYRVQDYVAVASFPKDAAVAAQKVADFVIDLVRRSYGARDLSAQDLAVTGVQPVEQTFQRRFADAQLGRVIAVGIW